MRHFRGVKRDANHKAIVGALKAIGASVVDLAACGGGVPDLLVGYGTRNVLLEVKRPGVAGRKRGQVQNDTNDKQAKFRDAWRGQTATVESIEQAFTAIGIA